MFYIKTFNRFTSMKCRSSQFFEVNWIWSTCIFALGKPPTNLINFQRLSKRHLTPLLLGKYVVNFREKCRSSQFNGVKWIWSPMHQSTLHLLMTCSLVECIKVQICEVEFSHSVELSGVKCKEVKASAAHEKTSTEVQQLSSVQTKWKSVQQWSRVYYRLVRGRLQLSV